MGILNLRNSAIGSCLLLFVQCNAVKDQDYVLLAEFPPIVIMNAEEAEIKQTAVYLKRNDVTIDSGIFYLYSQRGNNADVQFNLNKTDTLYSSDKIIFNLKGQEYVVSSFEKTKVKSSGVPYLISYKINDVSFIDRNGYMDIKNSTDASVPPVP